MNKKFWGAFISWPVHKNTWGYYMYMLKDDALKYWDTKPKGGTKDHACGFKPGLIPTHKTMFTCFIVTFGVGKVKKHENKM